jgi:hypothetical protein
MRIQPMAYPVRQNRRGFFGQASGLQPCSLLFVLCQICLLPDLSFARFVFYQGQKALVTGGLDPELVGRSHEDSAAKVIFGRHLPVFAGPLEWGTVVGVRGQVENGSMVKRHGH